MPLRLPYVLAGTLVLLVPRHGSAQTKQALTEKLSTITCDCLQEKLPAAGQKALTKDQAQTTIIQCFGVSIGKEMKAVQQVFGANVMSDKGVMNQLGRDIGAQMLQSCPTFMTYSIAIAGGNTPASSAATTGQTTGQWGTLGGTGTATLTLTVDKSQSSEFVWSRHFPQDDELLKQLSQLKGREVRVSWEEVEVLQGDTKQYRKRREITGIELL